MKRNLRCAAWIVAVLIVGTCGLRAYFDHREIVETEASKIWLDQTIIPVFSLKDGSIEDAVAELNKRLASIPGKPKGLHIEFATKQDTLRHYHREIKPDALRITGTKAIPGGHADERITFTLKDIPPIEAFRYVTNVLEWGFEIRERRVLCHHVSASSDAFAPLKTEEIYYSRLPFLFSDKANAPVKGNPD